MKNSQSVSGYFIALIFAGMTASCTKNEFTGAALSDSQVQPIAGASRANPQKIVGDTLAVVNYGDGNFVGFYEFSPGEVAIRHSQVSALKPEVEKARLGVASAVSIKLDQIREKGKSLVDVYKAIAPVADQTIIRRLADAQVRADRLKAANEPKPTFIPERSTPDSVAVDGARTASWWGCSPDYYNDNYGAQWFIDNYINENKFRKYSTNVLKAGFTTSNESWTKVVAMAPNFDSGIHFSGERLECYGLFCLSTHWVSRWSFDINARGVEVWYIYSDKTYRSRAVSYSPCFRVHLGVCNDTPSTYPVPYELI